MIPDIHFILIISYLHNKNTQIPKSEVKDIDYVQTAAGLKMLLASKEGTSLQRVCNGSVQKEEFLFMMDQHGAQSQKKTA